MDSKIIILILSLVSVLSCKDNTEECLSSASYIFEEKVSFYPDEELISITDTLWMEANIPTTNFDTISKKMVDFSSANNFSFVVDMHKLTETNPVNLDTDLHFKIIEKIGKLVPPRVENGSKEFTPIEEDGYYKYKIGFVPMVKGTFLFILHDSRNNAVRKNGACNYAAYLLKIKNKDGRLHLLEPLKEKNNYADKYLPKIYCFNVG